MSMNGFKLILFFNVCLNAFFNCEGVSQLIWMVPCRSLSAGNSWFLKLLNFGSFFKAMFSFVAAPLYSIFFNLWYSWSDKMLLGFFTKSKKVTLFVQLLKMVLASTISPFYNLTATGFLLVSNWIYWTLALSLIWAP